MMEKITPDKYYAALSEDQKKLQDDFMADFLLLALSRLELNGVDFKRQDQDNVSGRATNIWFPDSVSEKISVFCAKYKCSKAYAVSGMMGFIFNGNELIDQAIKKERAREYTYDELVDLRRAESQEVEEMFSPEFQDRHKGRKDGVEKLIEKGNKKRSKEDDEQRRLDLIVDDSIANKKREKQEKVIKDKGGSG